MPAVHATRHALASLALAFAMATGLGACATAPSVQTEHDPAVDFARYQTYSWRELPSGGTAMSMQRIVGDIPSFRVDNMPYGGVKGSGFGREGVRYAIADMTEPRLLVLRD